jgi:hypothetical protein
MFSEDSYSPPLMISGLGHVPEQAVSKRSRPLRQFR